MHRRDRFGATILPLLVCMIVGSAVLLAEEKGSSDGDPARKDRTDEPLPSGALARMGTLNWRHGGNITFVAFLPDGKRVVTAGEDDTIRLWERETGKEIRRFASVPVEPAGSGSDSPAPEKVVRMALMGMGGSSGNVRPALSSDGKVLAAATEHNVIQLWDVVTGKPIRQIKASQQGIAVLTFSPDGKILAARGGDQSTYLWETETGKEIRPLKPKARGERDLVLVFGGGGPSPCLAFSSDGKHLAWAESEQEKGQTNTFLKVIETETGKEVRRFKLEQNGSAAIAFSPDGKLLAYTRGNVIHLCAADSDKEIHQLKIERGGADLLVFSPDSKTLASKGKNDGTLRLWDVGKGSQSGELPQPTVNQGGEFGFIILGFGPPAPQDVAFAPDGKSIATGGSHAVRFWSTETRKETTQADGHGGPVTTVMVCPNNKILVSKSSDGTLRRWDAATGKELSRFQLPGGTTCVAVAPDGLTIATGNTDNSIRLLQADSGKELHKFAGPQSTVALAFSPDGKTLAARGGREVSIRLYDANAGKELKSINVPEAAPQEGGPIFVTLGGALAGSGSALVFSPDGKTLASLGTDTSTPKGQGAESRRAIDLFDVATGKGRKIVLPAEHNVQSLTFSADGRSLAAENSDQTVSVWEVASGKRRVHLGAPLAVKQSGGGMMAFTVVGGPASSAGPAAPVAVAFSPDGRRLASGAGNSVKLWDLTLGNEIKQLDGHQGKVVSLAFSPDGKALATGSDDTTVLSWGMAELGTGPGTETELAEKELETLWADLAGDDASKAYKSMHALAAASKQVIPFLKDRLAPTLPVDRKVLEQLITGLDSEDFEARQKATDGLEKLGELAVPALSRLLVDKPSLETVKRAEDLLQKATGRFLTGDRARLVRAVEILESAKNAEARKILEHLASGAPGALPTKEAQGSLERLGKP
jgi:WD40 repeat protein